VEFRNYLLAALTADDLAHLLPSLAETSFDRGQVLFEPGDVADNVFFPSNAVLSVVTLMRDGSAVESSTIGRESAAPLISALANRPVKMRVFAQVAGASMRLPAAALRSRAAASPALMALLLHHTSSTVFQAEQGGACNVLHAASARLARWLLMTQDRTGTRSLPLTQDYMAIMAGVQRTTISAVAMEMRQAGLIRYTRGNVEVVDRPGLEARACECYAAIREEFDSLGRDSTS
jgi:CRP-like cAMP-binding protein